MSPKKWLTVTAVYKFSAHHNLGAQNKVCQEIKIFHNVDKTIGNL